MAHLVTGYAGKAHINSADQGSFNASFAGAGEFVMEMGNQFAASIVNNNTVRIQDGDLLMQGRHIRIEPNSYEDVTIDTGTAGKKRIDLIVMTYTKDTSTGVETAALQVIKGVETDGTPTTPTRTSGNILNGASVNQMLLYKVNIDGVALTSVTKAFKVIPTYKTLAEQYEAEFKTACNTYLNSLNILDTQEEVIANTLSNQLAGALAVKEAIQDLWKVTAVSVTGEANRPTDPMDAIQKDKFNAIFRKQGNIVHVYLKRQGAATGEKDIPYNEYTTILEVPEAFKPIMTEVNYVNFNGSIVGQVSIAAEGERQVLRIGYFRKNGNSIDLTPSESVYVHFAYFCK